MRQALREVADPHGFIELPDFIRTALYHPELGYYCRNRQRVGRTRDSDFFTATSLRLAFSEIVAEAAHGLCRTAGTTPESFDWLEIGAEPDQALLQHDAGFRSHDAIGIGQNLALRGNLVVFSNELFDAQPFRQLRFVDGQWREFGVCLQDDTLSWKERSEPSAESQEIIPSLPQTALTGYTIDWPSGAASLARNIVKQDWTGVFIAFDYGKSLPALLRETPQGTARGYRNHAMTSNILEDPGEQDITCHVCWDHLENCLANAGFTQISLQSQEAFIAHRAPKFLAKAFQPGRSSLDPLRTKLKELMHPSLMGQKFQALSAVRI